MPAGLTKEQQLYAQKVFAQLLETGGFNQTSLGEALGLDQSRVSSVRQTGKTSPNILQKAALLARRSPAEVLEVMGFDTSLLSAMAAGPSTTRPASSEDPKFGTFLLRLAEVPGLRSWLNEHPEGATISEVWSGIQVYEKNPTLSRTSDGQPKHGWEGFFADLRAGRIGVPASRGGDASEVLALERAERPDLPPTTLPPRGRKKK